MSPEEACKRCGTSITSAAVGRKREYCEECTRIRKNEKAAAERAAARVRNEACLRCGKSIPASDRADRKYCGTACQSWVNRRVSGAVVENTHECAACLMPLTGHYSNAVVCSPRCQRWMERNPGVVHPSSSPRACLQCGQPLEKRRATAKFCSPSCKDRWLVARDRAAYNAKARRYQASDAGRAYRRAYQQQNAELRRQWARDSRVSHPERYRHYWKQWAEANPHAVKELSHLRRSRQRENDGSIGVSLRDWERMIAIYDNCCAWCGQELTVIHMDHVIPLARGGAHRIGNVVPACAKCNTRKHAMLAVVFKQRLRERSLQAASVRRQEPRQGSAEPFDGRAAGSQTT